MRVAPPTLLVLAAIAASPLLAQVTQRVSVTSSGAPGDPGSNSPSISSDARFVAFHSPATNLVANDTNSVHDVFVRDRQLGTTERVSVSSSSSQGNAASLLPSISADGRYVAFYSPSSNLFSGDTNGTDDVFVRDRQTATTERVSVSTGGVEGNFRSDDPAISGDGRYVAFQTIASNLVAGDTNLARDVLVHDRQTDTTERVSVTTAEAEANGDSASPAISADGRYVAFHSIATNLVPLDFNGVQDVFVRDRQTGTTERVSVATGGVQGMGASGEPAISADGRYVAFWSDAANLVLGDSNGERDVFLHDRQTDTTVRVSVTTAGVQGTGTSEHPAISADGRFVAFETLATNLVPGDTNAGNDILLRDLVLLTTERATVASDGTQANASSWYPSVSSDGRYVGFYSLASNLAPGDTGGADVFLLDRQGAPNFTQLCDPGVGGVINCPCGNPPGTSGRGCNNSSNTGGATLAAEGGTYLSSDTLVFTTTGERPTSLSIVAQWLTGNPTGVPFGMGIRCTGGTFKRLYNKNASGGSITAPNFGAGDMSVSAVSAAKGDVIQPGQSRWYAVYYRDPNVLGGCPATATFNMTTTGQVTWSP